MIETNNKDKFDLMPFIALIQHISKNKLKYTLKNSNINNESYYLIEIHEKKDLSQDDLANIFAQSKSTIAKALKKLEDKEYVERKVDKNNRRKYILKTTKKGEKLAVSLKNELHEWEKQVGIEQLSDETIDKIREIARKSEQIVSD